MARFSSCSRILYRGTTSTTKERLPTKDDFLAFFKNQEVSQTAKDLFRQHYLARGHAATAGELAGALNLTRYNVVNRSYGACAKSIISYWVTTELWSQKKLLRSLKGAGILDADARTIDPFISVFMKAFIHKGHWIFYMSDELARAIQEMGWVRKRDRSRINLDRRDPQDPRSYEEGGVECRSIQDYERSVGARRECISLNGDSCMACGISFGTRYGKEFAGFIIVHHVRPMAKNVKRDTDPAEDLKPLCPNCHAMVHYGRPAKSPRTMDELGKIVARGKAR